MINLVEIEWGSEECRRHHPAMNMFFHGGGGDGSLRRWERRRTQSKRWKSIHDVLALVGCDRIGRNWVGEWGMSPPPPSGFLYFPAAAQWRYNIATLAWMFQSRTMKIDNWFYSTTICDGRSHLRAGGWRQRRGHSHRWRGVISIIMIVVNIITFWWQRWRSMNCRL